MDGGAGVWGWMGGGWVRVLICACSVQIALSVPRFPVPFQAAFSRSGLTYDKPSLRSPIHPPFLLVGAFLGSGTPAYAISHSTSTSSVGTRVCWGAGVVVWDAGI